MKRVASFVAGVCLGLLIALIGFPIGISPIALFIGACGVVFLGSSASCVVLSLHGWPDEENDSQFSLYDFQRLNIGTGVTLGCFAVLSAAIEKLSLAFDLSPFEAGFSATLGLGFYAAICTGFYLFVTKVGR